MRYIKLAFISFFVLFLLITGISLLIPSHIRISKAINIAGDKDSVMALVKYPARWKNWYPGLDTAKLFYLGGEVKGILLDSRDSLHAAYIAITKTTPDEVTADFVTQKMRPVVNGWKA